MASLSRGTNRVVLAWRILVVLAVSLDLLAPAAHPVPGWFVFLKPTLAFFLLAAWTVLAIAMMVLLPGRATSIATGIGDGIIAYVVVAALPPSVCASLLCSLPVLDFAAFGTGAGTVTAAIVAVLYPAARQYYSFDAVKFHELTWFPLIAAMAASMGWVMQSQNRQEDHTRALVSIVETIQKLGQSATVDNVLGLGMREIQSIFDCNTCVVYLLETDDDCMQMARVAVADTPNRNAFPDFSPRTRSIMSEVLRDKRAVLIEDFETRDNEDVIKKQPFLRSVMIAPLMFGDEALGVLLIGHHEAGYYQSRLLQLFILLTNQLAVAIRNLQLHKTTETLAITDSLSGLYTHGHFQDTLDAHLKEAKYKHLQLSLLILDVDFFKKVNDTYGHPQGDALLRQMGALFKQLARKSDMVCRYGGDEFTITMPETGHMQALLYAEKLRHEIEQHEFVLGSQIVHITVSGGVATFPEDASTKLELVTAADAAMFKSKEKGRNRVSRRNEYALA